MQLTSGIWHEGNERVTWKWQMNIENSGALNTDNSEQEKLSEGCKPSLFPGAK